MVVSQGYCSIPPGYRPLRLSEVLHTKRKHFARFTLRFVASNYRREEQRHDACRWKVSDTENSFSRFS